MADITAGLEGLVPQPPLRSPRLSDIVAERLLSAILADGLPPGSKLPSERELGERFQVSRTVIREATRLLAAKGIIDVRPGSGLSVAQADPAAVAASMNLYLRSLSIPYEKIHEVRTMIEVQVAGLAAERHDEEQLARLRQTHLRLTTLTDGRDLEALAVADVAFHRQVAEMTGNELHLLMLDSIGEVMLEIRRATVANLDDARAAVHAHGLILDRIAAGDAEGARAAMVAHLDAAFGEWQRMGRPVAVSVLDTPPGD